MISYQVQQGDTISQITQQFNTDWQTLKNQNPDAIGRSGRTGNWFFREGATIRVDNSFQQVLEETRQNQQTAPAPPTPPRQTAADQGYIEHTIKPGETLWELAVKRYHVHVDDIIHDNNISNPRTIQPGQVIRIRAPQARETEHVVASWYGENFHGRPMANGESYNMYANTIAHKDIPLGTRVELKNTRTGQSVQAVVTDRGPYINGRDVDLSYGLARKLSLLDQGVGSLIMKVL